MFRQPHYLFVDHRSLVYTAAKLKLTRMVILITGTDKTRNLSQLAYNFKVLSYIVGLATKKRHLSLNNRRNSETISAG